MQKESNNKRKEKNNRMKRRKSKQNKNKGEPLRSREGLRKKRNKKIDKNVGTNKTTKGTK